MGDLKKAYDAIGELSKPRGALEFKINGCAYFAAEEDSHSQTPKTYWDSAKAYLALTMFGKFTTNPVSSGFCLRFIPAPNFTIDPEDIEIMSRGIRFSGCKAYYRFSLIDGCEKEKILSVGKRK